MATFAQLRQERKTALRSVKALQRKTDTQMERLERRIERMLKNVTYIDRESALTLIPYYNSFVNTIKNLEKGIADYIETSIF